MTKIKTGEAATTSEQTCFKCKKTLPKTEFYRDSSRKNGVSRVCKQCQIQYTQEWKRKNSKKVKEYKREYRKKNKEYTREYAREYRKKNKEYAREYMREYRKKNYEKLSQLVQEWKRKNSKKLNEYQRAHYYKNYEKSLQTRRRSHAKNNFGISLEAYDQYRSQSCCDICAVKFDSKNKPQLDHCHASGHIRGVLCVSCNVGLGQFKDKITSLQQAIAYLEKHKIPQLS